MSGGTGLGGGLASGPLACARLLMGVPIPTVPGEQDGAVPTGVPPRRLLAAPSPPGRAGGAAAWELDAG